MTGRTFFKERTISDGNFHCHCFRFCLSQGASMSFASFNNSFLIRYFLDPQSADLSVVCWTQNLHWWIQNRRGLLCAQTTNKINVATDKFLLPLFDLSKLCLSDVVLIEGQNTLEQHWSVLYTCYLVICPLNLVVWGQPNLSRRTLSPARFKNKRFFSSAVVTLQMDI